MGRRGAKVRKKEKLRKLNHIFQLTNWVNSGTIVPGLGAVQGT